MENFKKVAIANFTKTEVFGYITELFNEKRNEVLDSMRYLDIEDEENRKTFKERNESLKSFESFMFELKNITQEIEILNILDKEEEKDIV